MFQQNLGIVDTDLQLPVAELQLTAYGRNIGNAHLIATAMLAVHLAPLGIVRGLATQIANNHAPGSTFIRSIQDRAGLGQIIVPMQIGPLRFVMHRLQTFPGFQTQNLHAMCGNLERQFFRHGAKILTLNQITHLNRAAQFQYRERHRKRAHAIRRVIQSNCTHQSALLLNVLHQNVSAPMMLRHIGL